MPAIIAAAVFAFDCLTPRGVAASALYVLAPAACLWVPRAVMSTRMALLTSVLVVVSYFFDADIGIPAWISLTNTVIALALVWSVTWVVRLRNRHERKVAMLVSQVRGLRERAEAAETKVCGEVSRQLHEGVGQELAALGWGLDQVRKQAHNPKRVEATAADLRERVTVAQDALRGLAFQLRKLSFDQSAAPGETRAHIEWFARQTGIPITVHGEQLLLQLSPEGAICGFRVIQEALTNIAKHAHATSAHVEIVEAPSNRIQIDIFDDGRGMTHADRAKPASLGLVGLEERLLTLGGSLRVESVAPRGTRLSAVVPGRPARGAP